MTTNANKTRKFYKKRFAEKDIPNTNFNELKQLRTWFLTGSFNKTFLLYDTFDKSKIYLLKKYVLNHPNEIENLMKETYPKSLNKNTFIYALVLLSKESFRSKKIFKDNFEKIIKTPKQIYLFLEYCKKERGRGKIVQNTIKNWFKHKDIHKLERLFVEELSGYNWTAKDLMRIIKPVPSDQKENLLFRWLSGKEIDYNDYLAHFPLIYYYEKFRNNDYTEEDVIYAIKELGMKNISIPGNVKRTNDIIRPLVINNDINSTLKLIPRYLNKFIIEEEDVEFIQKNIQNCNLTDIQLTIIISKLEKTITSGNELKLYDILINYLMERVKSKYDNSIHIIDTNVKMLDEMPEVGCSPAKISISVSYQSNNIFNFKGERIVKNFPKLFEGEGFNETYPTVNYEKIFEQIDDVESKNIFIWSNNKRLRKKEFNSKIQFYKGKNGRILKTFFINLYNWDKKSENKFYEIYGINDKTERLLSLLINKEL
jgi:hypothetical protein